MKKCSRCRVEKPLSEFNKKAAAKDGHRAQCRQCQKSEGGSYYADNKAEVIARTSKYKRDNKVKVEVSAKKWRDKNPERNRARFLAYKNRNRAACQERDRAYRLNNKDKDAAKTAKRRADKRSRTPPWLTEDDFKEINSFYLEARRLEKATGVKHHVDHIVPLNGEFVSGLHVPWNLQVIPAKENLIKSNKFGTDVLTAQTLKAPDAIELAGRINEHLGAL